MDILLDPVCIELEEVLESYKDMLQAVCEACSLSSIVLSQPISVYGINIKAFKIIGSNMAYCETTITFQFLKDAYAIDKYLIRHFNKRFDFIKGIV
tara:strand:- start:500 stop:787 length:288 start_codon:yes stop_codon:yes gene_type:complete